MRFKEQNESQMQVGLKYVCLKTQGGSVSVISLTYLFDSRLAIIPSLSGLYATSVALIPLVYEYRCLLPWYHVNFCLLGSVELRVVLLMASRVALL